MNGIDRLYLGDFNDVDWERQPDGSIIILLSKRGERKLYRIHARNLYLEDEQIISDDEVEYQLPQHIIERREKAKENAATKSRKSK